MENEKITAADKHYKSHRKSVKEWQARNADRVRETSLAYQQKMKTERPEQYAAMLLRKKTYYENVVKVRNEKKKQDLKAYYKSIKTETLICDSEAQQT